MTPSPPKEDHRFVASAYRRYGDELRRYLSRRLHNEQDARELAQEVWTRLLRVDNPAEILEPLAYIYRTASNVIVEFRMRRRRERVSFDTPVSEHFAEHPLNPPEDDGLVEQLNRQAELERALASLPNTYRKVLLLKLTRGLSYREIGTELGFSARTVEQYFFRAMALLKSRRNQAAQG
jgi:RNA polymerase sigma factor (sigma-70 family)